ncbi:hypothetical protein KUTeg_020049 [Tegillarca granosa]|uniref:Uncharacterized protein n=1 Tax=Tegillarca granosa TaxID=220873 RepID=A0ABQ9EBX2_TEGGR|nr:hypothetical protein KUTeg_020049 [Tegillarca granosa]
MFKLHYFIIFNLKTQTVCIVISNFRLLEIKDVKTLGKQTFGETGAQKSSFNNLLLGTSILPTANLSCTYTICELRTCPDVGKSTVLTYKLTEDGEHMAPKLLGLHTATGLKQLADCIQETDEYFEIINYIEMPPILHIKLFAFKE